MSVADWVRKHLYLQRILVAFDMAINAVFGGDEDTTISLRTAQACRDGKRWGRIGCWLLDHLIEPNHCAMQFQTEESQENDAGQT